MNANLSMAGAPLGLQNGNGVLTLSNKRVDVTSFQGQMGGGTVTAHGGLVIRPGIIFDLAATGNGISLLYPRGVRSAIDGDLTLTGNAQTALLRGQIHLDRLSFTPDFDVSTFAQQFSNQVSSPPSAGFANDVQLQIVLQTGAGLNLVSRTLSLQGGANLRVQGTLADPVVFGRADITGGDVIFLANRYVIQGGSIAFVNPTHTEPVVNIAATTTIDQYNINLRLEGSADRLRTTYASDPALPPVDIINLLAFGKTTEAPDGQMPMPAVRSDRSPCSLPVSAARSPAGSRELRAFPNSASIRSSDQTRDRKAHAYRSAARDQQPVRDLLVRRDFDSAADNPGAISTEFAMGDKHRPRPERRLRLRRARAQEFLNG